MRTYKSVCCIWVKEFSVSALSKIKAYSTCNFLFEIMPISFYGKYLSVYYYMCMYIYMGETYVLFDRLGFSFKFYFELYTYKLFYYIYFEKFYNKFYFNGL